MCVEHYFIKKSIDGMLKKSVLYSSAQSSQYNLSGSQVTQQVFQCIYYCH